jgi:hypothetical protein
MGLGMRLRVLHGTYLLRGGRGSAPQSPLSAEELQLGRPKLPYREASSVTVRAIRSRSSAERRHLDACARPQELLLGTVYLRSSGRQGLSERPQCEHRVRAGLVLLGQRLQANGETVGQGVARR